MRLPASPGAGDLTAAASESDLFATGRALACGCTVFLAASTSAALLVALLALGGIVLACFDAGDLTGLGALPADFETFLATVLLAPTFVATFFATVFFGADFFAGFTAVFFATVFFTATFWVATFLAIGSFTALLAGGDFFAALVAAAFLLVADFLAVLAAVVFLVGFFASTVARFAARFVAIVASVCRSVEFACGSRDSIGAIQSG